MKTFLAFASITLATLSSLNIAQAGDDTGRSLTVQFADLDLDKPQGAASLYARIRMAARSVCEDLRSAGAKQAAQYKACVEFAISNAVARVDRPVLTDYIASRSGKPPQATDRLANQR